jgi:hypothetical protein
MMMSINSLPISQRGFGNFTIAGPVSILEREAAEARGATFPFIEDFPLSEAELPSGDFVDADKGTSAKVTRISKGFEPRPSRTLIPQLVDPNFFEPDAQLSGIDMFLKVNDFTQQVLQPNFGANVVVDLNFNQISPFLPLIPDLGGNPEPLRILAAGNAAPIAPIVDGIAMDGQPSGDAFSGIPLETRLLMQQLFNQQVMLSGFPQRQGSFSTVAVPTGIDWNSQAGWFQLGGFPSNFLVPGTGTRPTPEAIPNSRGVTPVAAGQFTGFQSLPQFNVPVAGSVVPVQGGPQFSPFFGQGFPSLTTNQLLPPQFPAATQPSLSPTGTPVMTTLPSTPASSMPVSPDLNSTTSMMGSPFFAPMPTNTLVNPLVFTGGMAPLQTPSMTPAPSLSPNMPTTAHMPGANVVGVPPQGTLIPALLWSDPDPNNPSRPVVPPAPVAPELAPPVATTPVAPTTPGSPVTPTVPTTPTTPGGTIGVPITALPTAIPSLINPFPAELPNLTTLVSQAPFISVTPLPSSLVATAQANPLARPLLAAPPPQVS